eukprot:TRINITY_DN3555_c0_g1_i1.p1 TRINITY_DN3555_c0_g1~~TRINITY_DN3555_c0_g1_i1.p1  ORF type:complete len:136 (-),score=31.62 TRINITY_DN3555_c0_g1_i1:25-378(-)
MNYLLVLLAFVSFCFAQNEPGVEVEHFKPNQIPCIAFDACGICAGDNSTCTDCLGVVNGDATEEDCAQAAAASKSTAQATKATATETLTTSTEQSQATTPALALLAFVSSLLASAAL